MPPTPFTPMIRRFRCWHRGMAKRKPVGCGPTYATNGRPRDKRHLRSGSPIPPIAKASIRSIIYATSRASCKPTAMRVFRSFTKAAACSSGVLGARAAQVCGPVRTASLGDRRRGAGSHRHALCHRERNPWTISRPAASGTPGTQPPVARGAARLADADADNTLAEIGDCQSHCLRSDSLECVAEILRRRAHRDRQQRRGTCVALCGVRT